MTTKIVSNLNVNSTTDVAGNSENITSGTAGTRVANCIGYDDGLASGISFGITQSTVPNASGRNASSPTNTDAAQTNREGHYYNGIAEVTFGGMIGVTSCDVVIFLCTGFGNQTNIVCTVNGSAQAGFDATGNTTGTWITVTGVVPSSNQVVIDIENVGGSGFVFMNGFWLENISTAAPSSAPIPIAMHHLNQMRS